MAKRPTGQQTAAPRLPLRATLARLQVHECRPKLRTSGRDRCLTAAASSSSSTARQLGSSKGWRCAGHGSAVPVRASRLVPPPESRDRRSRGSAPLLAFLRGISGGRGCLYAGRMYQPFTAEPSDRREFSRCPPDDSFRCEPAARNVSRFRGSTWLAAGGSIERARRTARGLEWPGARPPAGRRARCSDLGRPR